MDLSLLLEDIVAPNHITNSLMCVCYCEPGTQGTTASPRRTSSFCCLNELNRIEYFLVAYFALSLVHLFIMFCKDFLPLVAIYLHFSGQWFPFCSLLYLSRMAHELCLWYLLVLSPQEKLNFDIYKLAT